MKKVVSYVPGHGRGCTVVHTAHVHTKFNFDPDKLSGEIEHRTRNTGRQKATVMNVTRAGSEPNTYLIKFAHLDALEDIYAVIEEIERDVKDARAIRHLIGLCDEEEGR